MIFSKYKDELIIFNLHTGERGNYLMGENNLLYAVNLTHFSFGIIMPEPNHISNFIQQFCFRPKNHLMITLKQYKPRLGRQKHTFNREKK